MSRRRQMVGVNARTRHTLSSELVTHLPPPRWSPTRAGQARSQTHVPRSTTGVLYPRLPHSRTFPRQLFITVPGHPNYSKIDILNSKKTSEASVNEMFNACYSSYVSFTSNLWAWRGTFIMYDVYVLLHWRTHI